MKFLGYVATFIIVIASLLAYPAVNFASRERIASTPYLTSTYADYCYTRGNQHKNIKRKNISRYPTPEACGKPLKS